MSFLSRHRTRSAQERAAAAEALRSPQPRAEGEDFTPKSARRARLSGVDLRGADLRWADLEECDLRGADLSDALLDGANLSWARLGGARLCRVQFGSCRLVEADLCGADVEAADFSRVTGLSWAALRDVRGATTAAWPVGFDRARPRVAGPLIHRTTR